MITGTTGIFRGGVLSVNTPFSSLDVSAAVLLTDAGRAHGFGGDGRRLQVTFGNPSGPFGFTATRPSDLDPPIYTLAIGSDAGSAYVAFDSAVTNDLVAIPAAATNYTVFGKVSWPTGATAMSQLTLDFSERQESRIIKAVNPLSASNLYALGSDFSDISFNDPLVSFSVLSEVLQGELKSRSGDEYHVSLIKRSNITNVGTALTILPFVVLRRFLDNGADTFEVIDTKVAAAFTYDVTTLVGSRIYVTVDPATGVVGSSTSYSDGSGFLVSYGDVPLGATGLQDVNFILASEISQSNAQSGAEVELYKAVYPSGFAAAPVIQSVPATPNAIALSQVPAIVNGVQYNIPAQQFAMPAAPTSGDRLDFVFVEFYRVVEAVPPTDGTFYVPLAGVGYLSTRTRLTVVAGATRDFPDDMMLASGVVGIGGDVFVRDDRGHFKSAYSVAYDGQSYALPLGNFYRFNTAPWSYANLVGGGLDGSNAPTRPDGKRHNLLGPDEWEILAPVVPFEALHHEAVLGQALDLITRGAPANMLGASLLVPSYFSKRPLQVDTIATTPVAGTHALGAPDGVRRQWSAAPTPYWVGTSFSASATHTDAAIDYTSTSHTIVLKSPVDGLLYLDANDADQPVTSLTWVETGLPVILTGPWSVDLDARGATATVDTTATGYDAAGTLSISLKVIQNAVNFLGAVPSTMLQALLNGTAMTLADASVASVTYQTTGNRLATITPIGATGKGDVVAIDYVVTADGTNLLTIPATVEGRTVLGPITVRRGNVPRDIKTFTLGTTTHVLTLLANETAGNVLTVHLALGGTLVNYRPKNRSIDEFATGAFYEWVRVGGVPTYTLALPGMSVLKGLMSFQNNVNNPLVTGVYVDGRLYPAVVTGFNRNAISVTLALSGAEYAALASGDQASWDFDAVSSTYRLTAVNHAIKLPMLASGAPQTNDVLAFTYQFASLPFLPIHGGEVFQIVQHGFVIGSSSSIANASPNAMSPLAERFPRVRGTLKGVGATPVTSFTDLLQVGQLGAFPFDGTLFTVDGTLQFDVGVLTANAGFYTWVALVRLGRRLFLFAYVIEGDTFSVADTTRAFLGYLPIQLVE